jgi:hypothetical protein
VFFDRPSQSYPSSTPNCDFEPMGIDFTALMDHSLSWDELCRLPEFLDPILQQPSEALYQPPGGPNRCRWLRDRKYSNFAEEFSEEGRATLEGPFGFNACVFRTTVEVTHVTRWWAFIHEPAVATNCEPFVALSLMPSTGAQSCTFLTALWRLPRQAMSCMKAKGSRTCSRGWSNTLGRQWTL